MRWNISHARATDPVLPVVIINVVKWETKGRGFTLSALIHAPLLSWDLNCGSLKTNFNHFNEFNILLLTEISLMSLARLRWPCSIVAPLIFIFFTPPPPLVMHPFLINQTFSLLFSSNQGMTLKQGCRIANIAWTPFSVRISERSQTTDLIIPPTSFCF